MELSIVIICKNGEELLSKVLDSVQGLGNEILFYDSGSCDRSKQIAKRYGAKIIEGKWEGYGRTRWKAAQLAQYDWILMLDADEVIDKELKQSISKINLQKLNVVYDLSYKNFFGDKHMRHGEWGNDSHVRLGNRKGVRTDGETVHEKLFVQPGIEIKKLQGYILHYTVKNSVDLANKQTEYAWLCAEKYFRQGKRTKFINLYFSPMFTFLKNYFFKLGFLDGWQGFVCAKMSAWYTFLKYSRLKEIHQSKVVKEVVSQTLISVYRKSAINKKHQKNAACISLKNG